MTYQQFNNYEAAKNAGITHMITVGRRQPMHAAHLQNILDIIENGFVPIITVGSSNGATKENGLNNQHFDPLRNPLNYDQQAEQIRAAMAAKGFTEGTHYHIENQPDRYDNGRWSAEIAHLEHKYKCKAAYHAPNKQKDMRPRRIVAGSGDEKEVLAYDWELTFPQLGLPVFSFDVNDSKYPKMDASPMRMWDLNNLSPEQKAQFAAPEVIIELANAARAQTNLPLPVTMLDISVLRLQQEKGVTIQQILAKATLGRFESHEKDLEKIAAAVAKLNGKIKKEETVAAKVASANLNQTVMDTTNNVPNILAAIDKAIADGADILSLEELVLTAYSGDGYFDWLRTDKQQQELIELVQYIADYANERDPNLIISVGFPLFYADKSQPSQINLGTKEREIWVDNPLYNHRNKPFNAVALVSGGKINSISAKSIQPDGAAEYEPRQFSAWPDYFGATEIELYNGQKLPFGKVINQIGEGAEKLNLYFEICAEAWRGINDDGTINEKERNDRYLKRLIAKNDISLALNPSASKPEPYLEKAGLRQTLCTTGSKLAAGYVYSNCSGNQNGGVNFDGGSIFAVDGNIVHETTRYNFDAVNYGSVVMNLPVAKKGVPHVIIPHKFKSHANAQSVGSKKEWEELKGEARKYEEVSRNTALWLRDYLVKTGQQGFFISLSGGKDSAYGAVAISAMIDLAINHQGVEGFLDQFPHLKYANEVREIFKSQGQKAAVDLLKSKLLTCSYFPGDNSSESTRYAAEFLINGGTLPNGRTVKGIGGTFYNVNVQDIIDDYIFAFAQIDKDITPDIKARLKAEVKECVDGKREFLSEDLQGYVKGKVLSWQNKADDLTLQNIQARARCPMAWLFGNDKGIIPCVTSNWSEAVAGYWTFAGDGHMGSINLLGGIPKSFLKEMLHYLENVGLCDLGKVEALRYVNDQTASAELRPLDDGEIVQFDEDDMMKYPQLDCIAISMIIGRNYPFEACEEIWNDQEKAKHFSSKEQLIECIEEVCWRWNSSQFKRVASVITPFLAPNVDPHTCVRTTILSDGFTIGRAQLKLEYLKDQLGGEDAFKERFGVEFNKMRIEARVNKGLKNAIVFSKLNELENAISSYQQQTTQVGKVA